MAAFPNSSAIIRNDLAGDDLAGSRSGGDPDSALKMLGRASLHPAIDATFGPDAFFHRPGSANRVDRLRAHGLWRMEYIVIQVRLFSETRSQRHP
jgi:hypothetical protein